MVARSSHATISRSSGRQRGAETAVDSPDHGFSPGGSAVAERARTDAGCIPAPASDPAALLGQDMSHHLRPSERESRLSLSLLDPVEATQWDSLLEAFPEASFFHSASWAAVLKESVGFTPCYLVLRKAGETVGVLPIMEVRNPFAPSRGVSLPFTDYCSPLVSDEIYLRTLTDAAHSIGRARDWSYLEIRGHAGSEGTKPDSVEFCAHTLQLPSTVQSAFAGAKSETRTAVRKALKAKVEVKVTGTLDALREFYHLYLLTRRKHGLPPQPFRFFRAIHRNVLARRLGVIVMAYSGKRPVAGAIFFRRGDDCIFKYGASDPDSLGLRANNLVMWGGISWCVDTGAKSLHMGRSSLAQQGLRRFKRGWGAREGRLSYQRRCCWTGELLPARDSAVGWYNPVFRALPLPVLKGIGTVAYRYVA